MGGDLTVRSEEGRGSVFLLTFKAEETHSGAHMTTQAPVFPTAVQESRHGLRGARVLLTDDNAINRQVIKLFLAPQGLEIVEATNGKEALDLISSTAFDLVLLDVHMPVMDGKEAIRRIRQADQPWSGIPVIALTADAMSGDREKLLAHGMTDYLPKPVDQRELISMITRLIEVPPPDRACGLTLAPFLGERNLAIRRINHFRRAPLANEKAVHTIDSAFRPQPP